MHPLAGYLCQSLQRVFVMVLVNCLHFLGDILDLELQGEECPSNLFQSEGLDQRPFLDLFWASQHSNLFVVPYYSMKLRDL